VLQCVAVCCNVLQCVAQCCSVLQCVAVNTSLLWVRPAQTKCTNETTWINRGNHYMYCECIWTFYKNKKSDLHDSANQRCVEILEYKRLRSYSKKRIETCIIEQANGALKTVLRCIYILHVLWKYVLWECSVYTKTKTIIAGAWLSRQTARKNTNANKYIYTQRKGGTEKRPAWLSRPTAH